MWHRKKVFDRMQSLGPKKNGGTTYEWIRSMGSKFSVNNALTEQYKENCNDNLNLSAMQCK